MDNAQAPEVPGFSVDRLLGRGGSASVWLVRQERTGRGFALKCFDRAASTQDTGNFSAGTTTAVEVRREIRILSVLEHPHLVRAHDALSVRGSCGDQPALLMDYASGGSLASLVAARGRLTAGETVTVLTPLAQVLGYLHGKGMTHSDVSPGNVLFTGQGKPLLADLGITRMVGDPGGGDGHGTPGFLDPAPVDAVRAGLHPEGDVYAAAAVGWFCLTGSAPPRSAVRPPLTLLRPEVPKELAAALESGLNEDRRLRPTATELATAVYRSAPPLPLDLAPAVHPSVIPELLTRRHGPARQASALNERLAERARTFTAKLPGVRRRPPRMPFPAGAPVPADVSVPSVPPARGKHVAPKGGRGLNRGGGAGQALTVPRYRQLAVAMLATLVAVGWWVSANVLLPQDTVLSTAGGRPGAGAAAAPRTDPPIATGNRGGTTVVSATAELERARKHASATDPAEAVVGLAALRSMAFSRGRPELLDEVNSDGSPADSADRKTIRQLAAAGTVLAGFTTGLSAVQLEPGSTEAKAVVQATSTTSAYEERDSAGALVGTGQAGQPLALRLVLVSGADGWRIVEILPGD